MRRRRVRKSGLGVSLFPFLAVLICAMGALIVLFVMVVQQARVGAEEVAAAARRKAPVTSVREEQKAEAEWQWEALEQQRQKLAGELQEQRLALAHLEEHIRTLEQRWQALQARAQELQQIGPSTSLDSEQTAAELARLETALATARQELQAAQLAAAERPRSFAIVPYVGPNGTHRRPIFIECRRSGIVLQPEGVTLEAEDFEGPMGPGNVLDAALRATREYLARANLIEQQGEPYPLLVVRPEGIEAYGVARLAMSGWQDEFGYELIEADTQLTFPPPDPQLAEVLRVAVAAARQRQAALRMAMPKQFEAQGGSSGVVASPGRGGFVPRDGGRRTGSSHGFGTGTDRRFDTGADAARSGEPTEATESPQPKGNQPPESHGHHGRGTKDGKVGATAGTGVSPIAQRRGANWALPNAAASSTGIARTVRVACLPDRLILLPERGVAEQPRTVVIQDDVQQAVDQFVAEIGKEIESWGIAVAGGYWKPTLQVHVGDGAEQRFAELQTLLQGSGLEIVRSPQR